MKKLIISVLLLCLSVPVVYAGQGRKKEAKALVKKAIVYLQENGREKALAEFNNPKGKFVDRDLYIFVDDMKGIVFANGQFPGNVGKNDFMLKDNNGNLYVQKMVQTVKEHGKGWVEYTYMNPLTKKVENKASYIERYEDVMVCGGYYK